MDYQDNRKYPLNRIWPLLAVAGLAVLFLVLHKNFSLFATAQDQPAAANVLISLSAVKQGNLVRVEMNTQDPPAYQVMDSDSREIIIELKATALAESKSMTLADSNVAEVRADQMQPGPQPAVWVVVELRAPAEYTLSKKDERTLVLEIKEPEGPAAPLDLAAVFTGDRRVVMDLHSDILYRLSKLQRLEPFDGNSLDVTMPHLQASPLNAQVFVVFTPPYKGFEHAELLLHIFDQLMQTHADKIAPAVSVEDLLHNLEAGKISAFLGMEGGEPIGDDLGRLDYFYQKGVRYLGLVWNKSNLMGDAALDKVVRYHGLSPLGKQAVQRMNQLGMLVDVAHMTPETVSDVLALSQQPVIDSHTGCYGLRQHPRNLRDDHVRELCAKGGVIGVIYSSNFLTPKRPAHPEDVVDHMDYIAKLGGINCVALGSDWDGGVHTPVGLEDPTGIPNLTRALKNRGYSPADIDKIYGLNFLRVLQQVSAKK